jgi:hypothetical protein
MKSVLTAIALAAFLGIVNTAAAHPSSGIVVTTGGTVCFIDTGHGVWRIAKDGRLESLGGPAFHFLALDRRARFSADDFRQLAAEDIVLVGDQPSLLAASSYPIAVGEEGDVYYPTVASPGRVRIMRMTPGKKAAAFADLPVIKERDGEGREFNAEWIRGLAPGPGGTLYYTEKDAVKRITSAGEVTTVASGVTVDQCDRPAGIQDNSQAPYLYGLAVDKDGVAYVAASGCSAVLKLDQQGKQSTVLRASDNWSPHGVAVQGDQIYVLEYRVIQTDRREDWLPRVRKVSADGTVTTIGEVKAR